MRQQEEQVGIIRKGDRVRVGTGATGRVVAVINGTVYRVRLDQPDLLGNRTADYIADALRVIGRPS
jgi:preprotein translocase subunit YajC